MTDYIKVEFDGLSDSQKEIVIALLSDNHFDGFEEEGDLLKSYVHATLFQEDKLKEIIAGHHLSYTLTEIRDRNWNLEWESNFQPVLINSAENQAPWVAIRAEFHEAIANARHEIVITPKMSFGTGHHATTNMMISMMEGVDFNGKAVLDFGTGTGILAILAEKLGASKILAIDNDDQSIMNAAENFRSNACTRIELLKASTAETRRNFDIVLANIIKVVIIDNLRAFIDQLRPGGIILFSGLLKDDENDILGRGSKLGLTVDQRGENGDWICLKMRLE